MPKHAFIQLRSAILAIGLSSLVCVQARATGILPLAIPGNVSVTEGGDSFQMTFQVTNNTGTTLLVDYAFASITPVGPDASDLASFAGNGGSNGLASASLYILAGHVGQYTYNVFTPNPPDGNDFGDNRFDFYIEMQQYTGTILPTPNNISSAGGGVVFVADNGTTFTENPAQLTR